MNTADDMDMAETTTLTVRLTKEARDKLDALAESTRRSRAFLAAEAINWCVLVSLFCTRRESPLSM